MTQDAHQQLADLLDAEDPRTGNFAREDFVSRLEDQITATRREIDQFAMFTKTAAESPHVHVVTDDMHRYPQACRELDELQSIKDQYEDGVNPYYLLLALSQPETLVPFTAAR